MSLAFSVSALAGLDGFRLFLPLVVLTPCGKEAFIPGLGFGISTGGFLPVLFLPLVDELLELIGKACQILVCSALAAENDLLQQLAHSNQTLISRGNLAARRMGLALRQIAVLQLTVLH